MGLLVSSIETLQQAIDAYILFAKIEGRMPSTLITYQEAFADLEDYLGSLDKLLSELSQEIFRNWIAERLREGYAKATINIRLRVFRSLFHWLQREGYLQNNPTASVKLLRVPKQYPFVLNEEQVKQLLKAVNRTTFVGKRNWCILLMFLDGMLRLSELINIRANDVNLQNQAVRIRHGKGEKERIIFMGRRLTRAMQDWFNARGFNSTDSYLFVTSKGYKLDQRNIARIIERLAKKARIHGVRCSPHTLRHTGATLFIRYGGDPFSLQRLLGHSDISTTMIYVHMAGTALREAHAKASPVDRLLEG